MNRGAVVVLAILVLLFIFVVARLHDHFADHATQVAAAQEAHREHAAHERRLAWQRAHPTEYARQKAEAHIAGLNREQQVIAHLRALPTLQAIKPSEPPLLRAQAGERARQADVQAEKAEVSAEIHPSDLVQSFVITDSKLGLVIDRDVWDALSKQDQKMFFGRIEPIWDAIYARHNPGSSETSDVMLFDLNNDIVTDYGSFTLSNP